MRSRTGSSTNVSILLGAAGGSFETASRFTAGSGPISVALGDFNGDSDLDLAVANFLSGNVSILLGAVGGSFTGPTDFAVGEQPNSIAVGDFNGDSDPDLAIANLASNNIAILRGGVGGTFTRTNFAADFRPGPVAVGDFNGDSDPDLAVANFSGVAILLGGAGASFTRSTNLPVAPGSIAVGDFNGDSDPDLAVTNQGTGSISILLGGAGASFTGPTDFAAGVLPGSIAVGDFNGDSDPDLAVANSGFPGIGDVSILLGAAGGSFTGPTSFALGSNPFSVAVGDFNSDSDPDLAVTSFKTVSILLGAAGGSFEAAPNFAAGGSQPVSIVAGDFNADSASDLAVANEFPDNVSILLNTTVVNRPPECSGVAADPGVLLPPNHKFVRVTLRGATDPDGDPVTLAITGVTQDEPVNGNSDGNTSPDARRTSAENQVFLRAERSGNGNGRVYRIAFTASDGKGGTCEGTATAAVPLKSKGAAVDSTPPSYDSLGP